MRDHNPGASEFRASLLAALNPMLAAEFVPKLTYFDNRGNAEVIRLMMEETGTLFNERRISIDEWPEFKSNFIYAQLPVFEEGDLFLNDIDEIYRHLAHKLKLNGETPADQLRCDLAHEMLALAQGRLFEFFLDPAFADKRSVFEKTELYETLHKLESFLVSNLSDGGYWIGEKLSYIDIFAWHYLDSVRPLAPQILGHFESLAEFRLSIQTRPNIKAYLKSDRRPQTLMLPLSFFGGTPETS